MMNVLIILQGPAYGDERAYNGLRLAASLAKRDDVNVRVFCFGDAVGCAIAGQKLPDGYYHLDRMITSVARHGAEIALYSTCMDARGITDTMLIPVAPASTRPPTGSCGRTRRSPSDATTTTDDAPSSRWSTKAETYDAWFDRPWGAYATAVEHQLLFAAATTLAGLRVCDAGCGTGRFAQRSEHEGAQVIGVDRDRASLALAARRVAGPLILGDVHALPFPEQAV